MHFPVNRLFLVLARTTGRVDPGKVVAIVHERKPYCGLPTKYMWDLVNETSRKGMPQAPNRITTLISAFVAIPSEIM